MPAPAPAPAAARLSPGISAGYRPFPVNPTCSRFTADIRVTQHRISVYMTNVDPEDERDWPRQHEWLTSKINDFHRVFLARVRDLDAEDWKQNGEDNVSAGTTQLEG